MLSSAADPPLGVKVAIDPLSKASWLVPLIFHHPRAENNDDIFFYCRFLLVDLVDGFKFTAAVAVSPRSSSPERKGTFPDFCVTAAVCVV